MPPNAYKHSAKKAVLTLLKDEPKYVINIDPVAPNLNEMTLLGTRKRIAEKKLSP